jgi:hypothetical protein
MLESLADPLEYYARQSPITDPKDHVTLFERLPGGIADLCEVVQGLMVHHGFAHFYGVELTEERRNQVELRRVAKLLACILELDDRPLTAPRQPERRLTINCRDFSVMLCAMLRHQGVPARARCGFAVYFGECPDGNPGFNVDHWVCEYWKADEDRWVLVDAEVGQDEREYCHVQIDTGDVPRDQFLVAGKAWELCRAGEADPERFGLNPDGMRGLWYIQSQLVRDLGALNKTELLCWDCWGLGDRGPDDEVSAEEIALLDRVAALTAFEGNEAFSEMRSLYERDARLCVPSVINSYTRLGPRKVNLTRENEP